MSIVSSSATLISSSTPAIGEGTSVSTLSVETSSSGSSTSTVSPTAFSQRVTVASVTDSPIAGSVIGVPEAEPPPLPPPLPDGACSCAGAGACGAGCCWACGCGAGAACCWGWACEPGRPGARAPPAAAAAPAPRPAPGRPAARRRRPAAGRVRGVADDRQLRADLDRLVLADLDRHQEPGRRGRDLGVDLVGGDLEQRLVDLDPVAFLLQPAGDGGLGDRLTHRGQNY